MTALPRRGLLRDKAKEKALTGAQIDSIGIKTVDAMHPVNSLSGGNMQKVVLGKCLSIHPDILLLNNPTRGIDIKARQDIYALLRELCSQGVSILLLTEDLLELLGMSDRILLLKKKSTGALLAGGGGARPWLEWAIVPALAGAVAMIADRRWARRRYAWLKRHGLR